MLLLLFLFFTQSCYYFLFMRLSAVEEIVAFVHCVGKLSLVVGQNILDYFFLVTGMEEDHIGPWMVSQLMQVFCLTDLMSLTTLLLFSSHLLLHQASQLTEPGKGALAMPRADDKRAICCSSNNDARLIAMSASLAMKISLNSPLKPQDIFNVKKYSSKENVQTI